MTSVAATRNSPSFDRRVKQIRALAFLALGVLTALASIVAASGHAASTAVPACATQSLVTWLDTRGNGAAGSVFHRLRFTNLSGRSCTLRGYPGISAVDIMGRPLGSPASRDPQRPVRTVAVGAAQTVHAVLQINDVDVFPRASCRPVVAAGVRVFPPNQTRSKVVPFPFRACSQPGPAYIHVQAVTPGAG